MVCGAVARAPQGCVSWRSKDGGARTLLSGWRRARARHIQQDSVPRAWRRCCPPPLPPPAAQGSCKQMCSGGTRDRTALAVQPLRAFAQPQPLETGVSDRVSALLQQSQSSVACGTQLASLQAQPSYAAATLLLACCQVTLLYVATYTFVSQTGARNCAVNQVPGRGGGAYICV